MNKELINYTKRGHSVLYNGVSFRLISKPDAKGYAHAVSYRNWETWDRVDKNLKFNITPSEEDMKAYRSADTTLDLNACMPLEKVRFMYKGEQMEVTTGDSILINGEKTKMFFIDISHLECVCGNYSYTYHLSQFVDLIRECNADIRYLPEQAA